MLGNVRTEWWSITGIATYVIGGRNESRDVYLRFRDNSLIIHVSIFLTGAIYYLQGSECILPRAKRSRKSPLSIPFILRDRRFLSPLIAEHPTTPAHIFPRSPPLIFLIFARNWLNVVTSPRSPLPSPPLLAQQACLASTLPLRLFFFFSFRPTVETNAEKNSDLAQPRWSRLEALFPMLARCSFATLITGYVIGGDSSSPVKAERNIFMERGMENPKTEYPICIFRL